MKHYSILILFCGFIHESVSLLPQFPFNMTFGGDCSCAFRIEPVCGRKDNIEYTYINECILKCSEKLNRKKGAIELLYKGACCRAPVCTQFDSPVCDHNGKMYGSTCDFELAQCVEHRMKGKHLGMDTTAPKCACVRRCSSNWDPVCDSNGRTHANLCTFVNYRCYHKMEHNENLEVDYMGTCCDDICRSTFSSQLLCDSDNVTHSDLCSFYKSQCRMEKRTNGAVKLSIQSIGACKSSGGLLTNSITDLVARIFNNNL